MKKNYIKPAFHIEAFTLTQTVAAGCGVAGGGTASLGAPNHWGKSDCGWALGDTVIWTAENGGCNFAMGADDEVSGLCYNNPNGGTQIFGSY